MTFIAGFLTGLLGAYTTLIALAWWYGRKP